MNVYFANQKLNAFDHENISAEMCGECDAKVIGLNDEMIITFRCLYSYGYKLTWSFYVKFIADNNKNWIK